VGEIEAGGGGRVITYLTIITTVLVLTQIIRVTQNALSLRHMNHINDENAKLLAVYTKLEKALDIYLAAEESK
jgi:hypothetical protein